jgi:hypothetical protein
LARAGAVMASACEAIDQSHDEHTKCTVTLQADIPLDQIRLSVSY